MKFEDSVEKDRGTSGMRITFGERMYEPRRKDTPSVMGMMGHRTVSTVVGPNNAMFGRSKSLPVVSYAQHVQMIRRKYSHVIDASGSSAVAIDNKIEQAMDLVKSHLMFAVREEVDVLKERITELMDRISQLEYENSILRAQASQETLAQLGSKTTPANS